MELRFLCPNHHCLMLDHFPKQEPRMGSNSKTLLAWRAQSVSSSQLIRDLEASIGASYSLIFSFYRHHVGDASNSSKAPHITKSLTQRLKMRSRIWGQRCMSGLQRIGLNSHIVVSLRSAPISLLCHFLAAHRSTSTLANHTQRTSHWWHYRFRVSPRLWRRCTRSIVLSYR